MVTYFKPYFLFFASLFIIFNNGLHAISVTTRAVTEQQYTLTISFPIKANDYLYADLLKYSIDCPEATITHATLSTVPVNYYDVELKEDKKIIKQNFTITLTVQLADSYKESIACNLVLSYYLHNAKKTQQEKFPLSFQPFTKLTSNTQESVHAVTPKQIKKGIKGIDKTSWYYAISNRLNQTNSLWLQLLFALLLGLLVSFTPCIYPMIPITIGILQSQSSKSIYKNFLLALAYSLGLATTFAILGLLAAFTGQLFGSLLTNKWFVLIIVAIMVYIACSMIGFYDLYVPSLMQPGQASTKGGSYISAFIFGVVSGTVASPCLSPGLLLLLTLVTTIGSKIIGFVLLFAFGIGLSIPLLIIGTFSSSLSVLPQAGQWMVDIKQFSGFVMLGICFYFLKPIAPLTGILVGLAIYLLGLGIWYITTAYKMHGLYRAIKIIVGIMLIVASLLTGARYIQELVAPQQEEQTWWLENYMSALAIAQQAKKPILLEVTGDYCSICTAIDKKIFCDTTVQKNIVTNCIPVKIKNLDTADTTHAYLSKKFNILGVPTCIIIDPNQESCCKQWGPELYDLSPEEFLQELNQHCNLITKIK